MNKDFLKKYATLAVKTGINLQQNQLLVIMSPIECAPFTRMIMEEAYKAGAKEVIVHWSDELSTKIRFINAPEEVFETMPQWQVDSFMHYAEQGAGFLSISASNPELLKDVNPDRIAKAQKTRSLALKKFNARLMSNQNSWSIVSIPTEGWASKVFSEVSKEEAIEKLWNAIFKIVRVDQEDPVLAWENHKKNLKEKMDYLNSKNFKTLHFKNAKGTDLHLELPENHLWVGGAENNEEGVEFIANMPTEEVFSMPKKTGVNGIVYSSKPLNYGGNLIDNFSITFKEGRIVDFTAESGYDTLKHLISTDEGSHYLGEVALVPYNSPISNSGIIFYNTLYDENASCHLAIGRAYSLCMKDGEKMSEEELEKAGGNYSLAHVDFMIGTEDLSITGISADGNETYVFQNGNWAF
ncbi:aminopeptidase [Clostridium tunisiense]|uniref:aminopeptidase n=1 Tax=Clostridium tunisiense TaxID=219748 RepID=UPI0002E60F40|nr:aminopeptidase [Clostridium tunisiense]